MTNEDWTSRRQQDRGTKREMTQMRERENLVEVFVQDSLASDYPNFRQQEEKVSREFLRSRGHVEKTEHFRNTFQTRSILPAIRAAHGDYPSYYAAILIL